MFWEVGEGCGLGPRNMANAILGSRLSERESVGDLDVCKLLVSKDSPIGKFVEIPTIWSDKRSGSSPRRSRKIGLLCSRQATLWVFLVLFQPAPDGSLFSFLRKEHSGKGKTGNVIVERYPYWRWDLQPLKDWAHYHCFDWPHYKGVRGGPYIRPFGWERDSPELVRVSQRSDVGSERSTNTISTGQLMI